MGIAVNGAEMAERMPPGAEQGRRDLIAFGERVLDEFEDRPAGLPRHGQQASGRQLVDDVGHDLRG